MSLWAAWHGMAWHGTSTLAWHGGSDAWAAWHGMAPAPWHGMVGQMSGLHGMAWHQRTPAENILSHLISLVGDMLFGVPPTSDHGKQTNSSTKEQGGGARKLLRSYCLKPCLKLGGTHSLTLRRSLAIST